MRPFLAAAACFPLLACAAASPPAPAAVTPVRAQSAECVLIPWAMPGKPLFKGTLNGREITFFVDTGAEFDGWINPQLASELGLSVVGKVPQQGPDDPTAGAPIYEVGEVVIGGKRFTGLRFADMSSFGDAKLPFDAIIGNGMLQAMQAVFDYRSNALMLSPERLEEGQDVSFEYGIPVLQLSLGGRDFPAHLDTGNMAGELMVPAEFARDIKFAGAPQLRGKALTAAGPIELMEGGLTEPVLFAGTALPVSKVRWPGAFDAAQLGAKGLAGRVVRIDWRTKKVAIREEAALVACPA